MKNKVIIQSDKYHLLDITINDTSQAPKDKNIFYNCKNCGTAICSIPSDNIGCDCGNVYIDKDMFILSIREYKHLEIYKKNK